MGFFSFLKKALPIALLFVATFGAGALAGVLGVGIVLGATAINELLKPRLPDGLGARLRLSFEVTASRMICYGQAATSGHLRYHETIGTDNEDLWLVIAFAGHEIDSIVGFSWGGTTITFTGDDADGDLNGLMQKFDHLGTDAQTVDTNLDTASTKWTSAHRLRGIAYSTIKLVYDQEVNNQIKNPVTTIKGRKLYDSRLDTTNGGSGSHRLADQSTWAWSENPALCIADYLIGIRVANSLTTSYDGQIIAGVGVDSTRIDWASVAAAADDCEDAITLDGGGSEDRYTCNGFIDPAQSHAQNLAELASSMGGSVIFQNGTWSIYAAVARAAVETRDENDILSDIDYRAKQSRGEMGNAVRGVYADIDTEYKPRDIIPLINSTYVTQDGGQELWLDVNLPMTTSGTMAQRLAKIALERSRMEKRVTASFGHIALQDQAMDNVTFSYAPLSLSSEKMRVVNWQMQISPGETGNTFLTFPMVLLEENDNIYAWTAATDEQAIPAASTVDRVERITDQRAEAPVNTAGAMVTTAANPITASEVVSNTKIEVAAWSYQFGHGTVSWNSGNVTGLAYSTFYYVYADDPRLGGGAVTYVATTTKINITAAVGRIYVGSVTTPAPAGGPVGGGSGGGQEP